MADFKNVNRSGFPVNSAFRQPYVHRLWSSYKSNYTSANVDGMNASALKIYKEQSQRLKAAFAKNNKMELKQADEALKSIEQTLKAMVENPDFIEQTNTNIFLQEGYRVDGNSFYSYSASAQKREELFSKDVDKLEEFVTKLGESLDAFEGISKTNRDYIESQTIEQQVRIPNKDMANAMKTIYDDGKADKGIKKLVAANLLLQRYAGTLPAEKAEGVPKVTDAEAKEIVRGLAGSMNGLKGGFFEIAVNKLLSNAGANFIDDIQKIHGLEITGSRMQGDKAIKSKSLNGGSTTSKTDLRVNAVVSGSTAELGLSLKTSDLKGDKKGKMNRTTTVHTGNLGKLIMRANALMEESTYHLVNTATHKTYRDRVYKASKAKMAAMLAFDALAGLGSKKDTSYFIMYQNKIVSIVDFLDQLGEPGPGGEPSLNLTIQGVGDFSARAKKLKKGENEVQRYIRSKEAMGIFLGLRAVLTTSSNT